MFFSLCKRPVGSIFKALTALPPQIFLSSHYRNTHSKVLQVSIISMEVNDNHNWAPDLGGVEKKVLRSPQKKTSNSVCLQSCDSETGL